MRVQAGKTKQREVVKYEPWLKLYPANSADDLLSRFEAASVSMSAFTKYAAAAKEAYATSRYPNVIGHVTKATARELGLKKPMRFRDFRTTIGRMDSVRPCDPWKVFATAIVLAKTPQIYVPDDQYIFCIGGMADKQDGVFVIENDHGRYWLHYFETWTEIDPDSAVLFE